MANLLTGPQRACEGETNSFLDRQAQLGAPLRISSSNPVGMGNMPSPQSGRESHLGDQHTTGHLVLNIATRRCSTLLFQLCKLLLLISNCWGLHLTKSEMTLAPRWLTLRSTYVLVLSLSHVRRRGWPTPSGIETRKENKSCFMSILFLF